MRPSLLLVPALAALGLACQDSKHEAPPAPEPTHTPAPPVKRDFGGGYKGTKWGMTAEEVDKVLGAPAEQGAAPGEPDLERRVYHPKDEGGTDSKKEIDAFFAGGKLLRATLVPHFSDDNGKGYEGTLRALTDKYGPGQPRNDLKDPRTGTPVDLVAWTDGTTLIQLRVDKLTAEAAKAQNKLDPRLYSTTQVIYTGIQAGTERERQREMLERADGGMAMPPGAPDAGR